MALIAYLVCPPTILQIRELRLRKKKLKKIPQRNTSKGQSIDKALGLKLPRLMVFLLDQWFSKCSHQISSISITWKLIRNATSQAWPQTHKNQKFWGGVH